MSEDLIYIVACVVLGTAGILGIIYGVYLRHIYLKLKQNRKVLVKGNPVYIIEYAAAVDYSEPKKKKSKKQILFGIGETYEPYQNAHCFPHA